MRQPLRPLLAASVIAVLGVPGAAQAQRAGENAVANADDAFGSTVGLESTGIYTEFNTRGFSPGKAGNIRIDGIYADPIGVIPLRLRASAMIRVGLSAQDYPFHAPTGIVDHKFRSFPDELGLSLTPTVSLAHIGARAVGAQLTVPGYSTLDLGLRHKFKIGEVPASARLAVNNVFDAATWKVVAANTLYPEERRKLTFSLTADL